MDRQPEGQAAGQRSLRRPRTPLAGRAGPARGRAGDGRRLPVPDRVPRRRDRFGRAGARRAGARLDGDAAAAHPARRQLRHRRPGCSPRSARSAASRAPGSWSATSASTRASASPAPSRPGTDGSASRARARHGTCSSRPPARQPRPATLARLPAADRRPPRRQHRHRRGRPQADRDRLAHAQPREDYAFARPSLTREKIRQLELMTGAEHQKGKRIGVFATREQHQLDKQLAAQAERAYRRLVQDWQPAIKSTGAAPGRASCGPSSGQAARQETAPPPAL